jgi:hypothetical protein
MITLDTIHMIGYTHTQITSMGLALRQLQSHNPQSMHQVPGMFFFQITELG